MKKFISVLCVIAVLTMSCSFFSFAVSDEAKNGNLVVLGDSIAQGVGADSEDSSYSYILAEERGYNLHNCARMGKQSAELLSDVTQNEEIRAYIKDADIIEISIGGNDFLLGNVLKLVAFALFGNYSPVEETVKNFKENFDKIIAEIRALNPDAYIAVQNLYNPLSRVPFLNKVVGKAIDILNESYQSYAETDMKYFVVDLNSVFNGQKGLIAKDFIHPSQKGHELIAETLSKEFDKKGI